MNPVICDNCTATYLQQFADVPCWDNLPFWLIALCDTNPYAFIHVLFPGFLWIFVGNFWAVGFFFYLWEGIEFVISMVSCHSPEAFAHGYSTEGPFEHLILDPFVDASGVIAFMIIFYLRGWEPYIPKLTHAHRKGFISTTRYVLTLLKYVLEYVVLGALSVLMQFAEPMPHGFVPLVPLIALGLVVGWLLIIFIFNKHDTPPSARLFMFSEEVIVCFVLWWIFVAANTWIYLPYNFQVVIMAFAVVLVLFIYTWLRGRNSYAYYDLPQEKKSHKKQKVSDLEGVTAEALSTAVTAQPGLFEPMVSTAMVPQRRSTRHAYSINP